MGRRGHPALIRKPAQEGLNGICAQVLAGVVTLDEWGYPIVGTGRIGEAEARAAVALCPAAALRVGPPPRS